MLGYLNHMLKVGIAQIRNSVEVEENFRTIKSCLKAFEANKPDVILFPECALSGFSSKIKDCTLDVIRSYLDVVDSWSKQNDTAVFLPTALKSNNIYNTGFCFQNGSIQQFHKVGLTESEKKFFSIHDVPHSKIFHLNGYRIGLLICFEAEMKPWEYFPSGSVDLILWPGYWGWSKDDVWDITKSNGEENKVFKNMLEWKVPLIQSNFAFNDLNDYRKSGPHGLSVFISSDNSVAGRGEYEEESCYLIEVNKRSGIQNIQKITINP